MKRENYNNNVGIYNRLESVHSLYSDGRAIGF
jgi:hypothetical protein